MDGSATFTIVVSSTIITSARQSRYSASQRLRVSRVIGFPNDGGALVFPARKIRRRSCAGLRFRGREAALIGENHGLDAVAEAELSEDPLDVRLDRRLLDDQRGGDLSVRQPAGD